MPILCSKWKKKKKLREETSKENNKNRLQFMNEERGLESVRTQKDGQLKWEK